MPLRNFDDAIEGPVEISVHGSVRHVLRRQPEINH
jgi:hypothetical protein